MKYERVATGETVDPMEMLQRIGLSLVMATVTSAMLGHSDVRFTLGYPYSAPNPEWTTPDEFVTRVVTGEPPNEILDEFPWAKEIWIALTNWDRD